MTTRSVIAQRSGPVPLSLDLPAGVITVTANPARTVAEVTVTARGDDPALHTAVRNAVLRWDERRGALVVQVPEVAGNAGQTVFGNRGVTVVQSFGDVPAGVTITGSTITGGVVTGGGRVVIDGVTVTGGGIEAAGQIEITAHVPEGSTVGALTRSAPLNAVGEFAEVDFTSTSGDLNVGGTGALRAKTVSGDVAAAAVDGSAVARSVSGDIRLGRADDIRAVSTSGDVTVADFGGHAKMSTVSGDLTLHAAEGGIVCARTVSGDVTVTASGAALAEGLTINATSRSGHVSTPTDTPPTTARARRPRRTTRGA
ncbi:DUF4097 family beta strand repeat-containing protein [Actinomadura xylanilytica]|uniref:DUF4097 family beta strand repeat-containing protein n=1 Tax=Actinomadura xylanilytica TaxID=887459 RepID=UPI00255A93C0|nr:DUF4097 family beta strand repeat-containing protein [Actinomadura xylanilytica]MDL4772490.1 DUF4097 family beta strand repeat-containing protein [Actinomadura xylanilytica]